MKIHDNEFTKNINKDLEATHHGYIITQVQSNNQGDN